MNRLCKGREAHLPAAYREGGNTARERSFLCGLGFLGAVFCFGLWAPHTAAGAEPVRMLASQTTPTVSAWPTATAITYGETLASSTLSGGSASVDGSFAFTVPGTVPSAGTAAQGVTFTPTDTVNYSAVSSTVRARLILNHTGSFGPTTTLNGVELGAETAFTIVATCDPTLNLAPTSAGPGLGVYAATASFEIAGQGTYQSAPGADLSVWLLSPSQDKSIYGAGIGNQAGDPAEFAVFESATPHFSAEVPISTTFSSWSGSYSPDPSLTIPLGDGTSTLVVKDMGEGAATAELIVEPVQEAGPEVTVNQSAQSIIFGTLPVRVYGDAPFTLTASASSGLPVSYVSADTTVATVTGSTVSILKAGSTLLTASQNGNNNYLAAEDVSQTLTVVDLQIGLDIRLESHAVILTLTGNPGREYAILYTDALTNADWPVLTTIMSLPFSPYSYADPAQALQPSRFYRVQHPVWIQPPE